MGEVRCDGCGHPILVCDVCRERVEGKEGTIQIEFHDAWGYKPYNFCCAKCMLKWLFELAPTVLDEPHRKGKTGEIHILGLDRCKFVALARAGRLQSGAPSKKGK